ncbi:4897_t:CDS:2 [Dentiscutata erythropus]|uniref:4897_t:CDS:1 n=1 Tax=Dentiscutata erythropus TaxID=1348616 RepID=A0A9N9DXC1_9GLOM|nr:4897_t:CDS:2 [Dentiscutata erythropus]
MATSIIEMVKSKNRKRTQYKNALIPMEEDLRAEASSSNSSIKTFQNDMKQNQETEELKSIYTIKEKLSEKTQLNNQMVRILEKERKEEQEIIPNQEHEKWRIETNAKRYKVWVKVNNNKGQNIKEKTSFLLKEFNEKAEFLQMIENKFDKIVSSSARLNGLYHTFWIQFESQETAEEILEQKSQIVGDECVCVTTPNIKYTDLLKLKETSYAAKAIDVPPTMTSAELFTIMKQIGAQTFKEEAIGKGYKVDQHMIKIIAADQKICHQCKSTDHLVLNCPIAKENKEREFRQKQNYQRFNQTYKRYQPRVYNTLTNKYTDKKNTYAEITKRRTYQNEQQQQYKYQQKNNNTNETKMMQMLENINNRLNQIEENIEQLNERVDNLQQKQEITTNKKDENEMQTEMVSNEETEIYRSNN